MKLKIDLDITWLFQDSIPYKITNKKMPYFIPKFINILNVYKR